MIKTSQKSILEPQHNFQTQAHLNNSILDLQNALNLDDTSKFFNSSFDKSNKGSEKI